MWTLIAATVHATGAEEAKASSVGPVQPNMPQVIRVIKRASMEYGLSYCLARSIILVESDYDPSAVSVDGAIGLMQLMPEIQKEYGVTDPFDPRQNVRAGVRYIIQLIVRFGDVRKALLAYNGGSRRVENGHPLRESQRYANRVLREYWRLVGQGRC